MLLVTRNWVPGTMCQEPGFWQKIFGPRYSASATRYKVLLAGHISVSNAMTHSRWNNESFCVKSVSCTESRDTNADN